MDELQISGKRFISSRRVAREHGYTADYVGQLIRGGKLTGQKVGRAWYVEAGSLSAFLGGEDIPPAPPPAPRPEPAAPEVAPVIEEPAPAAKPVEEKVAEPEPAPVVERRAEKKIEPAEERRVPLHVVAPRAVQKEEARAASGLRYIADEEPALPQLSVRKREEVSAVAEPAAPAPARTQVSRTRALALAALAVAVFGLSAFGFSAISLDLSVEEGNAATAAYSLNF